MTPQPDDLGSAARAKEPEARRQEESPLAELLRQGRLAWRLFTDERVPFAAKLVPLLAVLYILAPIDLVPDFLPALGQIDDLALLLLAVRAFIQLAPQDIVRETSDPVVSTTYRVRDE
jgi:uncharacterized membrane protein YkvA (DUF1232 family)